MRLLGRKDKVGLFVIMAITLVKLSQATTFNEVAPINIDLLPVGYEVYEAKPKNLKESERGSYLTQATMLVYDEILRYQRGVTYTHGLTAKLVNEFDYDSFAANVKWFMDELVGMESDWNKIASPGIEGNTAYGYVQFTEPSVKTAVNRYRYHINKFNSRRILNRRDWNPRGYEPGKKMDYPDWLTKLEYKLNSHQIGFIVTPATYDHKTDLDILTYDEVCALAFVHLHKATSKDYNFVQLALGGETAKTAALEIYKNNHHTNPDADTLARLEKFFNLH